MAVAAAARARPGCDAAPADLRAAAAQPGRAGGGRGELWLAGLGLTDEVALHVVMGGGGATQWPWRRDMHRPAIVIGTVDSLVSKALNRGYGIGRATYPIDFALVTNGAHWVIDEIQLCPESTTTLRQLAAFAGSFGTAEPFGLTCMSATVPESLLHTVDNPAPADSDVLAIEPASGPASWRSGSARAARSGRLAAEPGDYRAIAAAAAERHRPGTLTLVVLNTVEAARKVFAALPAGARERTLIHSRFRGRERQALAQQDHRPARRGRAHRGRDPGRGGRARPQRGPAGHRGGAVALHRAAGGALQPHRKDRRCAAVLDPACQAPAVRGARRRGVGRRTGGAGGRAGDGGGSAGRPVAVTEPADRGAAPAGSCRLVRHGSGSEWRRRGCRAVCPRCR